MVYHTEMQKYLLLTGTDMYLFMTIFCMDMEQEFEGMVSILG